MAEQIAKDPTFADMTAQLQGSVKMTPDGTPQIDPQQYMQVSEQGRVRFLRGRFFPCRQVRLVASITKRTVQ